MTEIKDTFDSNVNNLSATEIGKMRQLKNEIRSGKLTKDNLNFPAEEKEQIIKIFKENRDAYLKRAKNPEAKQKIWNLFNSIITFLQDPEAYHAQKAKWQKHPEWWKWKHGKDEWSHEGKWHREGWASKEGEISISSPEEAERIAKELEAKGELLKPIDQVIPNKNKERAPQRSSAPAQAPQWPQMQRAEEAPVQAPVYWQWPDKWVIPSSVERQAAQANAGQWTPDYSSPQQPAPAQAPQYQETWYQEPEQTPTAAPQAPQTPQYEEAPQPAPRTPQEAPRYERISGQEANQLRAELSRSLEHSMKTSKSFPLTNIQYTPEARSAAQRFGISLPNVIWFDRWSQEFVCGGRYEMSLDFHSQHRGRSHFRVADLFSGLGNMFSGPKPYIRDIKWNWWSISIEADIWWKIERKTINWQAFAYMVSQAIVYWKWDAGTGNTHIRITRK